MRAFAKAAPYPRGSVVAQVSTFQIQEFPLNLSLQTQFCSSQYISQVQADELEEALFGIGRYFWPIKSTLQDAPYALSMQHQAEHPLAQSIYHLATGGVGVSPRRLPSYLYSLQPVTSVLVRAALIAGFLSAWSDAGRHRLSHVLCQSTGFPPWP